MTIIFICLAFKQLFFCSPDLYDRQECEYLKAIARPRLQVSTVVNIKTGKVFAKFWTLQQML